MTEPTSRRPRAGDASYYEQTELWGEEHIRNQAHLEMRYAAIEELLPRSVRSVVEIGSGDGRVLDHLQTTRPELQRVHGLDRSIQALSHQARPVVAGSVDELPLRERGAEAVLCLEVLEHLGHGPFEATLQEMGRVADRWVLITVPNRENRRRSAVRCPACGCEYSPMRHLRSFDAEAMSDLVPGFRLVELREVGPRSVVYPRALRRLLERAGIVHRSGAPTCPQCNAPLDRAAPSVAGAPRRSPVRTTSSLVRRLVPKSRRRYWLCALYEPASVRPHQGTATRP